MREPTGIVLIAPEDGAEDDEPQNAPQNENEIRLRGHQIRGGIVREEEQQGNEHRHHDAAESGDPPAPILVAAGRLEGGGRCVAVGDGGADGGDIDDDADRRAAEEGNDGGKGGDKEDRVPGRAAAVQPPEPVGNHAILGHRQQKPACGERVADDVGEDGAEHRQNEDHVAAPSDHTTHGDKGRRRTIKPLLVIDERLPIAVPFRQRDHG